MWHHNGTYVVKQTSNEIQDSTVWFRTDINNLTSVLQNSWILEDLKRELRPDKHLKDFYIFFLFIENETLP